ncbi:tetratricopeptide repeat protein [Ruegeria marina]|uniref:TolB amino-terminal domain-containing protein n=1 Tax=Ruegeria marina TaxID=639004 RepID=A0A1G6VEM5_9RHOB|nr:tetratricopeptide repeat protein [Ruegeria marina]SDD51964.1 TolB amino-terminal domain-containing protein [Ruegeria marina]
MHRKLATILVGDIVGSTLQMERDEEGSVRRFQNCLGAVARTVNEHDGRVFSRAGDAVLAEFSSPVNALRAAMEARGALARVDASSPKDMRFGLHIADVMDVEGDLRGDGVNIAARIQSEADPGAIDTSRLLVDQVRRNSPCIFDDLGERTFKGISEPIRIFRVRDEIASQRWQPGRESTAKTPDKRPHSIAVAPLVAAGSADETQKALAGGMTDDLILELSRVARLFVVSSSASAAVAGMEPKAIGDRLGVRYVLSGSMRLLGDRIRLNLSLTETDAGQVVWSDRIQRPFDEFLDLMDAITAQVSATVTGRMLVADTEVARRKPTGSLTAYEYYLRGLDSYRRGGVTDDNIRESMEWFDKAVEADPNFARARAMWVCSASWLEDYDWDDGRKRLRSALEIDPDDPEANRVLGSILIWERRFDEARAFHERAMRNAPNDAYILGKSARYYVCVGEIEKALELLDKAEALDPFVPVWLTEQRAAAYYLLGRYADAIALIKGLPYQTRDCRMYRAACHVALGDTETAREIVQIATGMTPDLTQSYMRKREVFQDSRVQDELIERLAEAGLPE